MPFLNVSLGDHDGFTHNSSFQSRFCRLALQIILAKLHTVSLVMVDLMIHCEFLSRLLPYEERFKIQDALFIPRETAEEVILLK